ncbi:MtrAB system histidine kinase MtrB [Streptomyces sp. DSM 44917]|uniref:Sensor histidine kinase MtrB n=1 Tax=Streptomyces boetiae TaxID=3075541 RepID=A0ABU2LEQ5_9ACTN|nr:MtrAB system histidine kinase MtrB [Streptomyces sp. DSM 44917]MDT0309986.1 MtrAB system histidine kinase MtrB [Streptomyces sp. DSM 44917]
MTDRVWWHSPRLLPEGATTGRAQPAIRIFGRWARGPLLSLRRLWRRNIQLRVVASTLLLSLAVVLVLGIVVIGQVRNGLLEAKRQAAQSQAEGGFSVAAELAADGGDTGEPGAGQQTGISSNWMTGLVGQLASGGQGVFSIVALPVRPSGPSLAPAPGSVTRSPVQSQDVEWESSIPEELREALDADPATHWQYGRIIRPDGSAEAGVIVGRRLTDNAGNQYHLYYLFPFTQEERSLSLVTGTIATAGVFVVALLGAIAWLVVRQVVTPVRMAARIAERLAAGRLQERMKVSGEDDIARLGESFNKMARSLQLQIQQLEELSRMQRRFVSDVSHELRTPLTTVRMAADVIHEARGDFDAATARSAELLLSQLDRFESLLADLLEISRFDAGAALLEAEQTDLRDVVHRVVEGAEPLAERRGGRLLVEGAALPVVAEVDPRRIERVVRNLVVNAIEHGEGRDVTVRLADGQEGGAVAIAVRDRGIGLRPGDAERVFSRFWRADPARARTTGGTGLGLSIALEDAHLHGGRLEAWGEPGGGAQFRLTLPRTVGGPLRGSPIPLEPPDSRARRARAAGGGAAAGGAGGGAGGGTPRGAEAEARGERPGERNGERPAERPGGRPGEQRGERPGARNGERPGERPAPGEAGAAGSRDAEGRRGR